jgi:hypothetical protein
MLAAVTGEGSLEPPDIRMNKPTESLLQLSITLGLLQTKIRVAKSDGILLVSNDHCFQDEQSEGIHLVSNNHYFSYAFSLHLQKALANQKCRFKKLCGLIASQESVL